MSDRRGYERGRRGYDDERRDQRDYHRNERSRDSRIGGGRSGGSRGRGGGTSWRSGGDRERREDHRSGDRRPDRREYERSDYRSDRSAHEHDEGGRPSENAGIWIGGLPSDISERELEGIAIKFGRIESISIKSSQRDTFAFLHYETAGQARLAIRDLNDTDPFDCGVIKVAPAFRKGVLWTDDPPARQDDRRASYDSGFDRGGRGKDINTGYDGNRYYDSRFGRSGDGDRDYGDWGGRGNYYKGRNDRRDDGYDYYNGRSGYYSRYDNFNGRDGGGGDKRGAGGGRGGKGRCSERSRSRLRDSAPQADVQERDEVSERRSRARPWRAMLSQLPKDMEADELIEITSEFGKVLEHELHRESNYKAGWVEYATKAEAEKAVEALDDRRIEDCDLKLQAYIYPGGLAQNGMLFTR